MEEIEKSRHDNCKDHDHRDDVALDACLGIKASNDDDSRLPWLWPLVGVALKSLVFISLSSHIHSFKANKTTSG